MFEQRIFENFDIKEKFISVIPYGNGHINDTFSKTKGKIKVNNTSYKESTTVFLKTLKV